MPSPRACLLRGGEAGKGRDAGSYHPTGQTVAVQVPRGLKIPREQIAEACGRWWVLNAGPKGHYHLPVKQGVVQDDTSLSSSAMLPPTFQAPGPAEPWPCAPGSYLSGWGWRSAAARRRERRQRLSRALENRAICAGPDPASAVPPPAGRNRCQLPGPPHKGH